MEALEQVKARFAHVVPIVSECTADTDTRFGKAHDLMREMERICDHRVISTVKAAEPIGPQKPTCATAAPWSSPPLPMTAWPPRR